MPKNKLSRRVSFLMVRNQRYQDKKSGKNSFDVQPSKLKPLKASFEYERHLLKHIRAHENDLDKCQYCPFRYINESDYRTHMKHHFRIKDFKCDQCNKEFPQISELNKHYQIHEGILHRCLICNDYEAKHKISICSHLRRKHADVVGLNMNWDIIQTFIKTETLIS